MVPAENLAGGQEGHPAEVRNWEAVDSRSLGAQSFEVLDGNLPAKGGVSLVDQKGVQVRAERVVVAVVATVERSGNYRPVVLNERS